MMLITEVPADWPPLPEGHNYVYNTDEDGTRRLVVYCRERDSRMIQPGGRSSERPGSTTGKLGAVMVEDKDGNRKLRGVETGSISPFSPPGGAIFKKYRDDESTNTKLVLRWPKD